MLSQNEIHRLRDAAEAAWGDDTRNPAYRGHPCRAVGQCYVTSKWLQSRLGGHVGRKDGHYFWGDGQHALDLTGDQFVNTPAIPETQGLRLDEEDPGISFRPEQLQWRPGPMIYKRATHPYFADYEKLPDEEPDPRAARFIGRADMAYEAPHLAKVAFDLGDAYPASEAQAVENYDNRYMHDVPTQEAGPKTYNVVYGNGDLHISADHSHDELAQHAHISPDHAGPFAAGFVTVNMGKANWQLRSNVALHALERVLKDYGKHVGWEWGGLVDSSGQPINDDFAPKKSRRLAYVWDADYEQLYLGRNRLEILASGDVEGEEIAVGHIDVRDDIAQVSSFERRPWLFEALTEWADDEGLRLMAGDNVIKRIEDLEQFNLWGPDNEPQGHEFFHEPDRDERGPGGVFKCPECQQIFPRWDLYIRHREKEEPMGDVDTTVQPSKMPEIPDPDDNTTHPRNNEMSDFSGMHVGAYTPFRGIIRRTSNVEAAQVPGVDRDFFRHAENEYWTAYEHGCPVGCVALEGDTLTFVHTPLYSFAITDALIRRVQASHSNVYFDLAFKSYSDGTRKWASELPEDEEFEVLTRIGFWQTRPGHYRWSADTDPSSTLEGAVPFVYDVDKDKIIAGHPGERHSDIVGKFTPGGIVEGTYEPGGKVVVRSLTTMPYTVRHMLELWYYQYPQFVIKSVHLRDDQGNDTKLARSRNSNMDIGQYVANLAAQDDSVWRVYQALKQAGGKVYVVGGAVRDAVMGKPPKDLDLMVTGLPMEQARKALERLPGHVKLTGQDFGVLRYNETGDAKDDVEVSLPRRERSTGGGHKDFDVQADHTMSPEEDFYRRDFNVNAMGVDLDTGKLVDPFGGADAIRQGEYSTVSPKSFEDDPLRTVRGLALTSRHGLQPDDRTKREMGLYAERITHLPAERIQAELDKLFGGKDPESAIRLAHETGVLPYVFPEVEAAMGYQQHNPHHPEGDLGEHLLMVMRYAQQQGADPDLVLAALLHDIGKPGSRWNECKACSQTDHATGERIKNPIGEDNVCPDCGQQGEGHYYAWHQDHPDGSKTVWGADHADLGADMADERLRALKYPSDRVNRIRHLVAAHMFGAFDTTKGARRFINRYGDENADDLLLLRQADQGGKLEYPTDPSLSVDHQRDLVQQVRDAGEPTTTSNLAINGHDLMQAGMKPGPQMGEILRYLTEQVLDDPSLNNRDTLLQLAQQYASAA